MTINATPTAADLYRALRDSEQYVVASGYKLHEVPDDGGLHSVTRHYDEEQARRLAMHFGDRCEVVRRTIGPWFSTDPAL